jgi:hypothetical protein
MGCFVRKKPCPLLLTPLISHSNTQMHDPNDCQVKIRHDPADLESDVSLKLRVANCTHTAVAHAMALLSMVNTEALCQPSASSGVILKYLDSLYRAQILPGAVYDGISEGETDATWVDWRKRLQHPHFGLSTFFITQNGAAKCGIRLGPTIKSLVTASVRGAAGGDHPLSVSMAFAVAAVLRFLTPASSICGSDPGWCSRMVDAKARGIYVGRLDINSKDCGTRPPDEASDSTVTYADGLSYNLSQGWYEFRCDCLIEWNALTSHANEAVKGSRTIALPDAFTWFDGPKQPCAYEKIVKAYLLHPQGGNLRTILEGDNEVDELSRVRMVDTFASAVCTLYARMVSGDGIIPLLTEMMDKRHIYTHGFATPCACLDDCMIEKSCIHRLHYRRHPIPTTSCLMLLPNGLRKEDIYSVVFSEVRGQQVIDLHTHLLPPSHGALCLWGIDELLTYHYLVAEYFMTAPVSISPEEFYNLNKKEQVSSFFSAQLKRSYPHLDGIIHPLKQANLIWDALFIQRSPISEATRGVLTTLVALGLDAHVKARDLNAIRMYYDNFRKDGLNGISTFVENVMTTSGVKYAIMTNIPFDAVSFLLAPKKSAFKL